MLVAVLAVLAAHERQPMAVSLGCIIHTLVPSPPILVIGLLPNQTVGLAVRPFIGNISRCLIIIPAISMAIQTLVGNQHVSWYIAPAIGDDCIHDTVAVVQHGLFDDVGRISLA